MIQFPSCIARILILLVSISSLYSYQAQSSESVLLSFEELTSLSQKDRNTYLRSVAKSLKQMSIKKTSYSFSLFYGTAYADDSKAKYICIAGGIPVPLSAKKCGVSEYAGFQCKDKDGKHDKEMEICNPLLFGVNPDGSGICFKNATTSKCFKNIKPGVTSTTEPVYKQKDAEKKYFQFRIMIDKICIKKTWKVQEPDYYRKDACETIAAQTRVNKKRILKGGSEKGIHGFRKGDGSLYDALLYDQPQNGDSID